MTAISTQRLGHAWLATFERTVTTLVTGSYADSYGGVILKPLRPVVTRSLRG